ncbi:MAG: multidrug efflux SMR transporter [Gammaproteobacteria bacterium]|nr:QacE family quaternary ammonium compound efflux SMR transporter [Gammaproteobacteria bacterium]
MAWLILIAAGAVEIAMAISLKHAAGWTRLWPSVLGLTAALASVILLTFAVKNLPVTTAYAVWTGIGAVGVSLVGMLVFGESMHPLRVLCLVLIFGGMIALHLLEGRV